MSLTSQQIATLKAFIDADIVLNAYPHDAEGAWAINELLKLPAVPEFKVWNTSVQTQVLFDAITWANMTPTDTPDGTQGWANRSLACQGKQFNLQTMLMGQQSINAARVNVRTGLQDALTAIPSGVGGTNKSGGWANVQIAMQRPASVLEKLFAVGAGTPASPATMTLETTLSYYEVQTARG